MGRHLREPAEICAYRVLVLDDPEMLGVEAPGNAAVVIKFWLKTGRSEAGKPAG
jgi:hypothetical protein